ncbi:Small-conductance mechanosensitive channel [Aquamicrobium aerolatum DSM 21857]|uniref:Small-conductance mechanosensitive channel n=2 Tax=Aerobium TaxID=3143707 RepID=A0A1I3QIC0_9HYPH|nr:Small-conductance mechanosensitive channel [Aquamicrobium aerolatum DSM 21857]
MCCLVQRGLPLRALSHINSYWSSRNFVHRMKWTASLFLRLLVLLMLAAGSNVALAQTQGAVETNGAQPEAGPARTSDPDIVAEQGEKIAWIRERAEILQARVAGNADNDAVLVEIRTELDALARDLIAAGVSFRPRLAAINARLDEIGPSRGEGEPAEPETLARERQSLTEEKSHINALLGEAERLSLRVTRLIEEIAQTRRALFSSSLSRRYDISSALSPDVWHDARTETRKLKNAVSSWFVFMLRYKLNSALLAALFASAAAAVLFIGGRKIIGQLGKPDPARAEPSYLARLSVSFWSTVLPSLSLVAFLGATYFFYSYFGLLRSDIAQMMAGLFTVVAVLFAVWSLLHSVYAPALPNWRMVPVSDSGARLLLGLTFLMVLVTGVDHLASRINQVLGSPLTLTVAKSLVYTVLVGVLLGIIGLVLPRTRKDGSPPSRWATLSRAVIFLLAGGTIAAALLGYIGLARFIAQQVVVTGAILATMYLGYQSSSAVSDIGAFGRTGLGRFLDRKYQIDEATKDQLGLVFGMLINLLVLAIGLPLIFLQWGFQWGDIEAWTYNAANELRIGSISISLVGIVTGIVVFLLGYFGTRVFQRWLDGKVMARGRVDPGLRNSIGTAVGYAGIALAGLVAISAAGLDLSNLALVAGALSLGIGFGLQNIVNNFVSGLILLAERPFKVGDWIVASGVEGSVKKISVRATEVETFQRQTVIVPNSLLINASVANWTHRNKLGRVEVKVGASYESDPRRVQELLLEIVRAQPNVLKNPEPVVLFLGFGVSSLDFELRAFLADITSQSAFLNEVRFQIFERFKAEGIDLPYTQPTGLVRPVAPLV